jgi:hypothetical protein
VRVYLSVDMEGDADGASPYRSNTPYWLGLRARPHVDDRTARPDAATLIQVIQAWTILAGTTVV